MTMKKKILTTLSVVLILGMAALGILAYLSDTDSDVNVMTLGEVNIEQEEIFNQGSPLDPGVTVEKKVTVTNVGKSDAYVRTLFALENPVDKIEADGIELINPVATIVIDGTEYSVFVKDYGIVASKAKVESLKSVKLSTEATNEDVARYGDTYDLLVLSQAVQTEGFANANAAFAGAFPMGDNNENVQAWFAEVLKGKPAIVKTKDELIVALSAGKDVLLTKDIDMEADKTAPYGNKYAVKLDGGVIDGNSNELYMECYGDDYGIMTSGGTIKNLTITEGCRAVMIMYPTEDVVIDNCEIGGDGVLYPINTGEAGSTGVDLIVKNSVIKGWTSYGNIESASFTDCEFGQGTYYNNIYGRVLKPYVNTTLTNCDFVEHMNLDLSSLTVGHKVTFDNCRVNGNEIQLSTFVIPSNDDDYDTKLFTVDLPAWASSVADCVIIK